MSSQGSKLKLEPNGRVMGKSWLNMTSQSILVQIFVDIIVTKNCLQSFIWEHKYKSLDTCSKKEQECQDRLGMYDLERFCSLGGLPSLGIRILATTE